MGFPASPGAKGWRPRPLGSDGGQALHDAWLIAGPYDALLEGDHGQSSSHELVQLPWLQQEGRIRRPAVGLVARAESLVQEGAVGRERVEQGCEQWAMQVVRHDDRVEPPARERPLACFEVESVRFDARQTRQRGERCGVPVHRQYATSAVREETRVPAVAAREIEDARIASDEVREAHDPR